MKKSLSLMLAIALVFGLFNAMASAEVSASTPADAGAYLQKAGIIKGNASGDLLLNDTWEREDVAVLLSRLLGKETEAKNTPKSHTYADVRGTFYDGYLSWAREKGYMEGASATKFGFDAKIDNQSFAAVILRALGVDTTGAENYAKVPELAVKAGILPEGTDWKASATRGTTYVVLVTALNTPVGEGGQKLGEILGLPGFEVTVLGVSKIAQSGAKKITVNFNRALTEAEAKDLKAEVKNGQIPYAVTIKVAEDKKSADLEASFLPAGDYDVKVNEFAAVKVTVAAAVVTKVQIGATVLQSTYGVAGAVPQKLDVQVLNQFGEPAAGESVVIKAYSSANGDISNSKVSTANGGTLDTSEEKVDATITVTATNIKSGLSDSKTYKLIAASSATSIQLGTVAPLKDKTRISVNESGLVLPYTFSDQYGAELKLPKYTNVSTKDDSVEINGITFIISDKDIVNAKTLEVDDKGVLTFKTGAKSGTVVITAINYATGANHRTSVLVDAGVSLKTFQISQPASFVVKDEDVVFPYVAADNFGAPIANKDVPAAAAGKLTFSANGATVPHRFKANGDLVIKFTGTATPSLLLMAFVDNVPASQLTLELKDVAYPVSISGIKGLQTSMTKNATQTLDFSKLVVTDNLGRAMGANAAGWTLSITEADAANTSAITSSAATTSSTIKAVNEGSEKVTVKLSKQGSTDVSFDITFNVIKDSAVTNVSVSTVSTVYGGGFTSEGTAGKHKVTLTLTGKTADGTDVAVNAGNFFDLVTTSNSAIIGIDNPTTSLTIYGKTEGTATVTIWKNGAKLNEQTVTVSKAAPVATTVKFTAAEGTATTAATYNAGANLEVKDQYGVDYDKDGRWYSSDATVAAVDTTGVVTKQAGKTGIVTITFVSDNGLSATMTVNVE